MDVARLNMSHGEHADHKANYEWVRAASDSTGHAVGILADLQGPKIRLGPSKRGRRCGPPARSSGSRSTTSRAPTTACRPPTRNSRRTTSAGDRLLVDDGKVGLVVEEIDGNDVVARVTEGGPVSNNKGISLPGMNV